MPKTPDYFKGKTVMITGAASGIGRATALVFAREGANVICADIEGPGAEKIALEVNDAGGAGLAVHADATSRSSVEAVVSEGIDRFGRIYFQFNSAGANPRRVPFLEADESLWRQTYELNVHGVYYCMQSILPHMLECGGGVIVNMSSMAHRRGGGGSSIHYASAKGAVITMSLGVAREFADRGIRCIPLAPGFIDTPFQKVSTPEQMAGFLKDIPINRFGRAEEIAELTLFICSDACEFLTADPIYVNGGAGWR